MTSHDLRAAARAFAIEAHGDQRYGDDPYATHLDAVVSILDTHGFEHMAIAGYLHDTLEDTDVTFDDICTRFGEQVARAVAFCSDAPGPNRKLRKAATYARMRRDIEIGGDYIEMAVVTKVADRLANVTASSIKGDRRLEMYREEQQMFRASLFIPEQCDPLWFSIEDHLTR
ncbi:MAG: HD domain-containing protein [Bradymonadia bacterium]